MKRILSIIVCLAVAAGIAYGLYPDEFKQYAETAISLATQAWESVRANPVPAALGLGTFVLTVVYHKAKGKSLRESVEVAATRVTVVPMPREALAEENPVLARARARATRTQLLTDQIALQNRQRKLPEELVKAEKDACYSEQAVADAKEKLSAKQKAHDDAVARLESLRTERDQSEAELAEIDVELSRLAELV